MRSGGCGLQQTLTAEAASVLKHSLGLARRRGHAQVTPLHVAATLLTLRSSSLRRACLKSYSHPHHTTSSHPLQCRALELCFNVALNRLPTTPPPTFLHAHSHHPTLSNALIAALKRAQAHHRRGCIDQHQHQHQHQQQPLLSSTVKVELEQLIISILDDPSVSRVMREAGFSSTAVKNNLDDSSSASSVFHSYNNASGGVFSSPPSPSSYSFDSSLLFSPINTPPPYHSYHHHPLNNISISDHDSASPNSKQDIKLLLDVLLSNKRSNTVIVGDSVSVTEGLVAELMARLERAEVPDELKSTRFLKFLFAPPPPLLSNLSFMKREQVEMRLSELERKVDSIASGEGGVIVYLGDLKWTVQDADFNGSDKNKEAYSPVEHLVAEIGKLFCDYGSGSKAYNNNVWLMGTASCQTYMRCQMRQPPLDAQWALQAVPVPSTGLALTLHASSVLNSKTSVVFNEKEEQDKLSCCEECASNYEKEAQLFKPGQNKLLPSWLQSHTIRAHHKDELTQLRRKWNRLCHSVHQSKHSQKQWSNSVYSNHSSNAKIHPYSSSYPWWPNQNQGSKSMTPDSSSVSFADSIAKPSYSSSILVPRFRRQQSCTIEFNFSNETQKHKATEPSLDSLIKGTEGKEVKITLALGNSSFDDSGQTVENITDHTTLRRAHICKLLQENVPWQSQTLLSSIAKAVFVDSKSAKQNCIWLFMQGNDSIGKRRIARAIAESAFGSAHCLFNLDMRKKETLAAPRCEMLTRALKTHQQLVVLIENADFTDAQFKKLLAGGFETGKFGDFSTEEKPRQAIFILTNNGSAGGEEQNQDDDDDDDSVVFNLVLQVMSETKPILNHKRKAEWDLLTKFKSPRIEQKQEVDLVSEQGNLKKEFSRQSSFNNTLDLNIRAEEDDDGGERSCTNMFLNSIENRFVLNGKPGGDKKEEMGAFFVSKIKGCFGEVCGKQYLENFSVEEKVVEEMSDGCGSFTNRVFEKWVKNIFQSSLRGINLGEKEGIVLKLCWGGKGDRILDCGFMSSCLPRNIQLKYFMD